MMMREGSSTSENLISSIMFYFFISMEWIFETFKRESEVDIDSTTSLIYLGNSS